MTVSGFTCPILKHSLGAGLANTTFFVKRNLASFLVEIQTNIQRVHRHLLFEDSPIHHGSSSPNYKQAFSPLDRAMTANIGSQGQGSPSAYLRRLKYWTARSCSWASSRVSNVPRLRRFPVFGFTFREY